MTALVSVVIPVFNSQDYVVDCVQSVLSQTYQHFEVILVNDGSTDNTAEIIKKYHTNPKVTLLHIDNSGQSVARNLGIEHAKGKYLIFIDSDDCWPTNTLAVTVSLAEEKQLDMVLFDGQSFIDDKVTDEEIRQKLTSHLAKCFKSDTYVRCAPTGVWKGGEILAHQMDNNKFIASPVLYLYKLERFKRIRFVPNIIHEDNAFTLELFANNGRVMAIPTVLYLRRIRKNSIMTSPNTMRNIEGHLGVLKRMVEVFEETENPKIKSTINRVMRMTLSSCGRYLKRIDGLS